MRWGATDDEMRLVLPGGDLLTVTGLTACSPEPERAVRDDDGDR